MISENQKNTISQKKKGIPPALSFLALLTRSSMYKAVAILGAMVLAEIILFFWHFQKAGAAGITESFFNQSVYIVFFVAFGLLFLLLMHTQGLMGDAGRDTMRRLKLSGAGIFLTETFYNLFCILLLFVVQIWLAIAMLCIGAGENTSPQSLFLAFYRIEFLHCLLPMAETGKWCRNILLLFSFAMGCACGFGKRDYMLPMLTFLLTLCWFSSPLGSLFTDLVCGIFYALNIAAGLWHMRGL